MSHQYSLALRRIAPVLIEHESGYDLLRILARWERDSDEQDPAGWDTAQACHWLSIFCHEGQRCPLYAVGGVTEYEPGVCERKPWGLAGEILVEMMEHLGEMSPDPFPPEEFWGNW